MFAPIAIIGRSCLLPGAHSPDELWDLVSTERSAIAPAPAGRWRVDAVQVLTTPELIKAGGEGCVSDRGGFVTGFERIWTPGDYDLDQEHLAALDPLVHWMLHTGRAAMIDAGLEPGRTGAHRIGAIVGNLAYPSDSLVGYAASVLLPDGRTAAAPHPLNRFSTGFPVHLMCRALGLEAGGYALDAACASSLYAIKHACDWLRTNRADVMLAGASNRCDALTIHAGFSALRALSPSGRSRPFHRDADGLVPAEGAAFLVLKRLADAEAAGDRILGVIRGIGLSNDGRGGGLLAPSEAGQVRAMREAFRRSGLKPSDISLIECHATGTMLGDATELRSMADVYANCAVPIGSLKANLGHLVTVAGLAGIIKVLEALRHDRRPATPDAYPLTDALAGTGFRVLQAAEPWPRDGLRRAAVSGFGFGGNNAHLILEEPASPRLRPMEPSRSRTLIKSASAAVVGIGASVADGHGLHDFMRSLLTGESRIVTLDDGRRGALARDIRVPLAGLAVPPRDIARALSQQTLLMGAVAEALKGVTLAAPVRTCVFVGIQCDAEGTRSTLRLSLAEGIAAQTGTVTKDDIDQVLDAARVVGCMGNVPANRINRQYGFEGPSFTFFAEELSGIQALSAAIDTLVNNEADLVVVGATDLCVEPVHQTAAEAILPEGCRVPGDGACVVVLKRSDDALRDDEAILAIIETGVALEASCADGRAIARRLSTCFGHMHAARGLLEVTAAVSALHRGAMPVPAEAGARPLLPGVQPHTVDLVIHALGGQAAAVRIREAAKALGERHEPSRAPAPDIRLYAGDSLDRLRGALADDRAVAPDDTRQNDMRLVIVAVPAERAKRIESAVTFLDRWAAAPPADRSRMPMPEGIFFQSAPIGGELAFVFTGAAAAYPGMGRELALAFPDLVADVAARCEDLDRFAGWVYRDPQVSRPSDFEQLCGASFLCQLHTEFSRRVLGVQPAAGIGLSSGETNALFALGFWQDMAALLDAVDASGLYTGVLGGRAEAIHQAWAERGLAGGDWANYRVLAEPVAVEEAIAPEPMVHVLIINAPGDFVIGGDAKACERVVESLGRSKAVLLAMDLAVHCIDAKPAAAMWRQLHHRPVTPVAGIRLYANAHNGAYALDTDSVADALTAQAMDCVDFPRTILQAWDDGVRVFLEHGPRAQCSQSIRAILGDRPHLSIALDQPGRNALYQALHAAGALLAAGVPVDLANVRQALRLDIAAKEPKQPAHVFPAHPHSRLVERHPPLQTPQIGKTSSLVDQKPFDVGRTAPVRKLMPSAPALTLPVLGSVAVYPSPPASGLAVAEAALEEPRDLVIPGPSPAPASARSQSLGMIAAIHSRMTLDHTAFLVRAAELESEFLKLDLSFAFNTGQRSPADVPPDPVHPRPVVFEETKQATQVVPQTGKPSEGASSGPQGLTFSRGDLERLSSGRISSVLGPVFAPQDSYTRQVRMPMPPLLLADRVTGLTGEPGSMGRGTIWTETDVTQDAWYLHHGRMPAGVMIEAGQADLLLVSWLGADLLNQGKRIYRLLGCTLSFHGALPKTGDTIRYDIHVDGHARLGEIGMFFFHYDARIDGVARLSVRDGQAGFFTDEELSKSEGVLWSAESASPTLVAQARLDPPERKPERQAFDADAVRAFHEGRVQDCFGRGFERAVLHTRTPRNPGGKLQLLHKVTHFDPAGGPWSRGYLRAEWPVSPQDWFFEGHFKNDPCMPGTLMFEACLQAMAFAMTGLGFTLLRDGWRFEPVPEQTYNLRCRGQVTPTSRLVVYEIFIDEVVGGLTPTLYADVLGTVDGLKAFHCARLGLRLVPDWPLEESPLPILDRADAKPAASAPGIIFNWRSLLACATGRPSSAFGPLYERFDGPIRIPRLPSPPYHFMTRVTEVVGEIGTLTIGSAADVEYDIPADAWFFTENGRPTMPFCVLIEAMLQTCGWLASYVGCALETKDDLFFRHLDGDGIVHNEVPAGAEILSTRVTLKSLSRLGSTSITGFKLVTRAGGVDVATFDTAFGNFPGESLANQAGIAPAGDEAEWFKAQSPVPVPVGLDKLGPPFLGREKLRLIDRVTGFWPDGGAAGLGRVRAEKDVSEYAWFFKAHFFNDPVQPGSIGLEATLQTLQAYMLMTVDPVDRLGSYFEPIVTGEPASWKCRGQVLPHNRLVTLLLEVLETREDERGYRAIASASLWADGLKIYSMSRMGMRLVKGPVPPGGKSGRSEIETDTIFDPVKNPWVQDHRPTYTVPVLPLMSVVDFAAAAVPVQASVVTAVRDFALNGWFAADNVRRFQRAATSLDGKTFEVRLTSTAVEASAIVDRPVTAKGLIEIAEAYPPSPKPWAPLSGATLVHGNQAGTPLDLYEAGALFHGPAFQVLRQLHRSATGASALLDAGSGPVPFGALNQRLLDGVLHAIPNDSLHIWFDTIPSDRLGYPSRIDALTFFAPPPREGLVRCEVRPDGFADPHRSAPRFSVQLIVEDKVWAEASIVYTLFPKGPIGAASPHDRRAFLRDAIHVPGLLVGRHTKGVTEVTRSDVSGSDWLSGTLASVFALKNPASLSEIAVKQHAGMLFGVHPSTVTTGPDGASARCSRFPLNVMMLEAVEDGASCRVLGGLEQTLDLAPVRGFWDETAGVPDWALTDLYLALITRFVRRIEIADPTAWNAVTQGPVLYLCNHQVGVESPLFSLAMGALGRRRVVTVAKAEHRQSWIGQLVAFADTFPGARQHRSILYFDRQDTRSFFDVLQDYREALAQDAPSLMIHVEGTRSLSGRAPVQRVSAVLLDLATELRLPIVPVLFVGGLPDETLPHRLEFPVELRRQDFVIGPPIQPETLAAMPLVERTRLVCAAINVLRPVCETSSVVPGHPGFAGRTAPVETDDEIKALLVETLRGPVERGPMTERLLALLDRAAGGPEEAWVEKFAAWLKAKPNV